MSLLLDAPGTNNTAGLAFPPALVGTYAGIGKNWPGNAEEYEVYLSINSSCSEFGEVCGIAGYLPSTYGDLRYAAPVDCVDFLNGENPTGRCFMFAEDFRNSDDLNVPFRYTFVVLSEQTDSSLFWAYMQGGIAAASGQLYPLDQGEQFPWPQELSSFVDQQDALLSYPSIFSDDPGLPIPGSNTPLGSIFSLIPGANMFPERLTGSWTGDSVRNWIPNSPIGSRVELNIQPQGCRMLNFLKIRTGCGQIDFIRDDGPLGLNITQSFELGYVMRTECLPSAAGPLPQGVCFMFLSLNKGHYLLERLWGEDSFRFYTLSLQLNGNLFWSMTYGPVVKASGMLARTNDD